MLAWGTCNPSWGQRDRIVDTKMTRGTRHARPHRTAAAEGTRVLCGRPRGCPPGALRSSGVRGGSAAQNARPRPAAQLCSSPKPPRKTRRRGTFTAGLAPCRRAGAGAGRGALPQGAQKRGRRDPNPEARSAPSPCRWVCSAPRAPYPPPGWTWLHPDPSLTLALPELLPNTGAPGSQRKNGRTCSQGDEVFCSMASRGTHAPTWDSRAVTPELAAGAISRPPGPAEPQADGAAGAGAPGCFISC